MNKIPKYSDCKYDVQLLEELGIDAFIFIKKQLLLDNCNCRYARFITWQIVHQHKNLQMYQIKFAYYLYFLTEIVMF